ncbi:MAG: efflux RND transporter periplasmic adaptor subunit [bacterium]
MKIIDNIDELIKKTPLPDLIGLQWSRRVFLILTAVIIIIVTSIIVFGGKQEVSRFTTVKKGEFVKDLVTSGEIEAYSSSVISAPFMWGTNLQITDLKPEGSLVEKGSILVEFDDRDLKEQRDLAAERIETLKADLEKLKSQQSLTISNLENTVTMNEYSLEQAKLQLKMRQYESDAKKQEARIRLKEAENNLQRAKTELKSQKIINKSQLLQTQIRISQAQNNFESIEDRIEKFKLRSPTKGMIVYMDVRGERPKKGLSPRPGWPLMQIPDLSRMQTSFYLSEIDREKVSIGQPCIITLDAYPDSVFQGKIREISRLAQNIDTKDWLKGYKVYADIEQTSQVLKPGMTSKIRIILEKYEDVVFVSTGAIFEIKGQPVVFPVDKNKAYAVYPGDRNEAEVIIKRGVKPGMKLAMFPKEQRADFLGKKEEQERILAINQALRQSHEIFEEYGILYDYKNEFSEEQEEKSNIKNLPSFLQKRLKKDESKEESKPESEVEKPDRNTDKETFKVSPEMMKRIKSKETEKKETDK